VLIGNLTQLPQCRPVFDTIAQMYDVRFIIPANAEYQTAIGAALAYIKKIETSPVG
jgi:type II pantothenate kinase